MIKIDYSIELISDAEIATGMGSGLLDAIAPRDLDGNFIVPASHIKGLIRQSLQDASAVFTEDARVAVERILGSAGEHFDLSGLLSLSDARSNSSDAMVVSRTSLNDFGTAKKGSLRTTEAVPAGSIFKGSLFSEVAEGSGYDLLLRFALLSILEVGGSRSRGCGACLVRIDGENRKPGDLLMAAMKASYDVSQKTATSSAAGDVNKSVFVRLEFTTKSPICLPETPVVGNNTIRSGWTIPASAVQGMILTRINSLNSDVASACFESPLFRAWPMLPVPAEEEFDGCVPVRASASHKISKLANENNEYTFCDETIKEYEWKNQAKNAPIKSADGVLIHTKGKVVLWRSGDMARFLSAHGVVNGENAEGENRRNLFTVESLAERRFVGFVSMPECAYLLLQKALSENAHVQLGKSRSIRGNGRLVASVVDDLPLGLPKGKDETTVAGFIVQSPILLQADVSTGDSAAELLSLMVENAGWGKVKAKAVSASTQILFGWNRNKNGRQKAELVIAPGSVFVVENAPVNWRELVIKGLGEGRERGFGAILPHPGVAEARYRPEDDVLIKSAVTDEYAETAWSLYGKSKHKLSASQISRLLALCEASPESAIDFLNVQRENRPEKFWDAWEPVWKEVCDLIRSDCAKACRVFKVWYDLTVAEV